MVKNNIFLSVNGFIFILIVVFKPVIKGAVRLNRDYGAAALNAVLIYAGICKVVY